MPLFVKMIYLFVTTIQGPNCMFLGVCINAKPGHIYYSNRNEIFNSFIHVLHLHFKACISGKVRCLVSMRFNSPAPNIQLKSFHFDR